MDQNEREKLFERCLDKWGYKRQLGILQEECGELIAAVSHYKRGRPESKLKLIEELADVFVMADQIKLFIGQGSVDSMIEYKLKRISKKLDRKELDVDGRMLEKKPIPLYDCYD